MNVLTPLSPTYWSKRMGRKMYKRTLFRSQASFEERASLYDGQEVDRPYRADVSPERYTKGTALNAQDLTATSDKLQVNQVFALLMYVDNVDKIQNKWSAARAWSDEAGRRLAINIDAYFLYEALSAADTIDAGDVGGSNGEGITLTVNNILDLFAAINMKLDANDVPEEDRIGDISPQFYKVLWKYVAGRQDMLGAKKAEFASIGTFADIDLYKTNNLTGSAQWVPANDPGNTQTIVIQGVTFTFVSSIGSTAGNVLISGTVAGTIDNLVALINAGGVGDGVNSISLSAANQRKVQLWTAVDGTTYIEVRVRGASYLTVSTSDAADVWTATKQIQHNLFGLRKAIDVVVQKEPTTEMDSTVSAGKIGMNILPYTLFGAKTFNLGTLQILDVQIRSDAF